MFLDFIGSKMFKHSLQVFDGFCRSIGFQDGIYDGYDSYVCLKMS